LKLEIEILQKRTKDKEKGVLKREKSRRSGRRTILLSSGLAREAKGGGAEPCEANGGGAEAMGSKTYFLILLSDLRWGFFCGFAHSPSSEQERSYFFLFCV
jgi:hypothetical protein